jgi:hypothetical protein
MNKVHYNIIKHGDDSVILESKIPVEICSQPLLVNFVHFQILV